MTTPIEHNVVTLSRQIVATLRARLGTYLTALETAHSGADGPYQLPMPADDYQGWWRGQRMPDEHVFQTPCVGVLMPDQSVPPEATAAESRYLASHTFHVAVCVTEADVLNDGSERFDAAALADALHDYATALRNCIEDHLRNDADAAGYEVLSVTPGGSVADTAPVRMSESGEIEKLGFGYAQVEMTIQQYERRGYG